MTSDKFPWEKAPIHSEPLPFPSHSDDHSDGPSPDEPAERRAGRPPGNYPAELKLQVTLDALKGDLTQRELGIKYGVPQPLISIWKSLGVQSIRESIDKPSNKGRKKAAQSHPLDQILAAAEVKSLNRLIHMLRDTADQLEQASLGLKGGQVKSNED